MIDSVAASMFPIPDSSRTGVGSGADQQGKSFLNLLASKMGKPETTQTVSIPPLNPTTMSPYAPNVHGGPKAPEGAMKEVIGFVLKQEGSAYVYRDGGRESSKYGVLQSTARGYGFEGNIKDLTRAQAERIYEKMWRESGAQKLPHDLAMVHFDTYINSPAAARRMLKACGGDTANYLDLRAQRYARLVEKRPERFAKYAKGWANRVERLRVMVARIDSTSSSKVST